MASDDQAAVDECAGWAGFECRSLQLNRAAYTYPQREFFEVRARWVCTHLAPYWLSSTHSRSTHV